MVDAIVPVAPNARAGGQQAPGLGIGAASFVKSVALAERGTTPRIGSAGKEVELPVPVEWVWLLVRKARFKTYAVQLILHLVFMLLFIIVFSLIRPVSPMFDVQDALLDHTSGEPSSGLRASWERAFYQISGDGEWWQWVETALMPSILSEEYENGDSRRDSWNARFANTVGIYNTQTAPVRFRQVRVTNDSCDTPASGGDLTRPCWGEFSASHEFKGAFGAAYGNTYLTDLAQICAQDGFGPCYGTGAYVVDLPLNRSGAFDVLREMKQDFWLNEQTRVVAIETSWYNANLDLSTYVRWQVDISPGGRLQPSVVAHSCKLKPYATTTDKLRAAVEVICVLTLLLSGVTLLYEVRVAKSAYFLHFWNWVDIAHLGIYTAVLFWWAAYVFKDKLPFEAVSSATNQGRPDLSRLAGHFDHTANLASFAIILSFLKTFNYMRVFEIVGPLLRTLEFAVVDLGPFMAVFLLFVGGFSLAGHWIFGSAMVEFHTLGKSFVTLFLATKGGFPYEGMKQASPVIASIFATAWTLVVATVLANFFVAILAEWYRREQADAVAEDAVLEEKVSPGAQACLLPRLRDGLKAAARGSADVPEGDRLAGLSQEALAMLQASKLKDIRHLQEALHENDGSISEAALSKQFGWDQHTTHKFAETVRRMAELDAGQAAGANLSQDLGGSAEVEAKEQEQLRQLQLTVERLSEQLQGLRGTLHESGTAQLVPGQAEEGYLVEELPRHEEPRIQRDGADFVLPPVPGTVPDRGDE